MISRKSPAQRRYLVRLAVAMAIYLLSLFAAERLIDHGGLDGPAAWIVALVPGFAVASVFVAIGRLVIEETDEFMRMLVVRQALVATGIALSAATIYGFLEQYGLVAHIVAYWWGIIWFFGLGVGSVVNRLTLGSAGNCA
ncbi:hypothetical protein [Tsuneonella mangrovi]|uniref:hypothetical protein n=1 Tax=Tsuneonella mangrovi TaxID=1982042 RepID=UPI000BA1EB45|nr:hypothetical protein [Tsuneonella mangrovi]